MKGGDGLGVADAVPYIDNLNRGLGCGDVLTFIGRFKS